MTLALERPMSQVTDSTLADDIRLIVDNLPQHTYDVEREHQEIFGCEVILIDNRREHWQLELHDSGEIELLHQQYQDDQLVDIGFTEVTNLNQLLQAFPEQVRAIAEDL